MKIKGTKTVEFEAELFHCKVSNSFMVLLYERAKEAWAGYEQWKKMDSPGRSADYFAYCEALVRLLESLTVFHEGMGSMRPRRNNADMGCGSLKDRLISFAHLERKDLLKAEDFDFEREIPGA